MANLDERRRGSALVANGHDLLYQSGDQILAASDTVTGDTFVAEKPRVWIARLETTAAPSW